ncbi:MAG TPA: double-strand break repair protein AddB, partial [Rhizomicrobium sp.]|nr:double-strand break repair protein AddB [Rhizomicrobium sp.]
MKAKVFTIAAGLPFAETFARGLIEQSLVARDPLALADATIYLPTRRAVRTLGETFARILDGAALLPNLQPLGEIDEDEVLFDPSAEAFELLPAIAPLRRRLLLSTLVARWQRAKGAVGDFAEAALFARALEQFLDESATQEADLSRLESLAPATLAEHWADVRDFLALLRDEWPKLLGAEGKLEPAERRAQVLDARAANYRAFPPQNPVIAAGTTGSVPATARMLAAIAQLPNGAVVLPGLDVALDKDSWEKLDPGHPQYGMKELLARLGVERSDVRDWEAPAASLRARATLLRETLRPAPTTDAWRAIADEDATNTIARGLDGLSLIETAHPGEEALAIALILRETLETPARTAALVTPDRNLARRVAAELGRWNIVIDDSAGRPLSSTPAGTFLLLLAEAVTENFAPVPVLAFLKHPLAAAGLRPQDFRRLARVLDKHCLRGSRPDSGFGGLRDAAAHCGEALAGDLSAWLDKLATCFAPLISVCTKHEAALAEIAEAHAMAAEALAASHEQSGDKRLWQGDAGTAAAELVAALQTESQDLPPIPPGSYPQFLRTLMDERAVRPAYGRHPRLAILGPLEVRLQHFVVVVLG